MKKKPGAMLLSIGLGKRPEEDEEEGESEEMDGEENAAKIEAASEVMDALAAKDKEAFAEALEAFVYLCS